LVRLLLERMHDPSCGSTPPPLHEFSPFDLLLASRRAAPAAASIAPVAGEKNEAEGEGL
jgi:hypothetical protein